MGGEALAGRRRSRACLAVAAAIALPALLSAPAAAHPGHGADTVTVDGDAFAFTPPRLAIGVGDAVIWYWQGALFRNHSVTSDPGQAEEFDSDPGDLPTNGSHPAGDTYTHTFRKPGAFTYYCKNHPTMRGLIEVFRLPERAPPRLDGLTIRAGTACAAGKRGCDPGPAVARFSVTRRAVVVGRIHRLRGDRERQVESFSRRARAGRNRMRLPSAKLRPGRYRLRLVAYDDGDRRSNRIEAEFKIRRGDGG